jgi:hypothetical protein
VCPNFSQKKAVLQNYLTQHNIPFSATDTNKVLYIIRKPHIICAVILVNPCFIHVHDIIPCFPKRFDLSQIITPIINTKHLIVIVLSFLSGLKIN